MPFAGADREADDLAALFARVELLEQAEIIAETQGLDATQDAGRRAAIAKAAAAAGLQGAWCCNCNTFSISSCQASSEPVCAGPVTPPQQPRQDHTRLASVPEEGTEPAASAKPAGSGLRRGFLGAKQAPAQPAKPSLASHPPRHGRAAATQPQSSVMQEVVQERSTARMTEQPAAPQEPQRQPEAQPQEPSSTAPPKQVRFAGPATAPKAAPQPAPKRVSRFKVRLMESSDSETEPDADEVLSRLPDLDSDEEDMECCGGNCTHRARPFLTNMG